MLLGKAQSNSESRDIFVEATSNVFGVAFFLIPILPLPTCARLSNMQNDMLKIALASCCAAFFLLVTYAGVFAQALRVQPTETVCYGLQKTVLRFSVPAGYFVDRENPYVSITPLKQTPAKVARDGSVSYGARYPKTWSVVRDSATLKRDSVDGRETYLLIVPAQMDAGTFRVLYTFSNGKARYIDSTIVTVLYSGIALDRSKKAYYGFPLPVNDWQIHQRLRSYYPDGATLDSNMRFGFSLNNFAQGGEPPVWFAHYAIQFSPRLPHTATSASIRAVWRYPETGEEVNVVTQTFTIEQRPPEIEWKNVRVENVQTVLPNTLDNATQMLLVRFDAVGVSVPVEEIPIGVKPQDPVKPIFADTTCIRWGEHEIDTSRTTLRTYTMANKKLTRDSLVLASAENLRLTAVYTAGSTARYRFELAHLPTLKKGEQGFVRGTVLLRTSASIRNRLNGAVSADNRVLVSVPVDIEYGALQKGSSSSSKSKPLANGKFFTKQFTTQGAAPDTQEVLPLRATPALRGDAVLIELGGGSLVNRLREEFTPPYKRTKAIEEAEIRCRSTDDIKTAILERKPIPQYWLDNTENPADCEIVMNFYIQQAALPRIGNAFALFSLRDNKPDTLIGIIAVQAPYRWQGEDRAQIEREFESPVRLLSAAELRRLPTRVFERDDSTGAMIPVRGSMESWDTSSKNVYDYCLERLSKYASPKRIVVRLLRSASGAIVGARDLYEISTETLGEEVVMLAADSLLVRRLGEVFTPALPRTQALESAEAACEKTAEIKERIRLGKSVPLYLIDETGSPIDCETVKNYYTALAGLVRIRSVYILLDNRMLKKNVVKILGSIAYSSDDALSGAVVQSACFTTEDLKAFRTKEYEKDDSTQALVAVRGSMESASEQFLYDYCREYAARRLREGLNSKDFSALGVRYDGRGAVRRTVRMKSFKLK